MRTESEHAEIVDRKRAARMEKIDHLPPALRSVIHDYGYYLVDQFMRHGVHKAKIIRHLVEATLDEFSPTRGSYSQQGIRTQIDDGKEKASGKIVPALSSLQKPAPVSGTQT